MAKKGKGKKEKVDDDAMSRVPSNVSQDDGGMMQEMDEALANLVQNDIPERLNLLTELFKSKPFSDTITRKEGSLNTRANSKETNPFVASLFDSIRPHLHQLLQDILLIRMSINLTLDVKDQPIQGEMAHNPQLQMQMVGFIVVIGKMEDYCNKLLGSWTDYHAKRAGFLDKYDPEVEDHLKALVALDDQMIVSLSMSLGQLISFYMTLKNVMGEVNNAIITFSSDDKKDNQFGKDPYGNMYL